MRPPLAVVVAVALALPSCGNLFDPAAAVVNGDKITVDELERALEEFTATEQFEELAEQGDAREIKREFEQQKLSQLIKRKVLLAEARDRGIDITDAEIDARIDELRSQYASEEEFRAEVAAQGLSPGELRRVVFDQLMEEELQAAVTEDVTASNDDARAFYDDNIEDYTETRAQHILIGDRQTAIRLRSELQNAPPNRVDEVFARLARRFSEDPGTAQRGGDLGFVNPSLFPPEFAAATTELDEGEISAPVQTQFGFHIIRVIDRRQQDFDDVENEIVRQLTERLKEETDRKSVV